MINDDHPFPCVFISMLEKMARFGFCVASSLIRGLGRGRIIFTELSKIVGGVRQLEIWAPHRDLPVCDDFVFEILSKFKRPIALEISSYRSNTIILPCTLRWAQTRHACKNRD